MYAASALVLPLSNMANTWSWVMGTSAAPLDIYTLYGLIPILIGIIMYANAKPTRAAAEMPAGRKIEYPEADHLDLGRSLVGPGAKYYPLPQRADSDITLFDLGELIPPRGVVGGIGVPPWMPILEEKSLIARWAVTAHTRGDLVSPLLRHDRRRRHSSPPSPFVEDIARSPVARGHGIWIPASPAGQQPAGESPFETPTENLTRPPGQVAGNTASGDKTGFFEWGMQVEDFSGTRRKTKPGSRR
jgi:hypothetical protein